jgi:maltose alpha-D-glucosyltransferase/alpha-amylase
MRTISQVRFSDWTMLRGGATPAFLALISVSYTDGWSETYQLPLAFASGDQAASILRGSPSGVLARVTGARKGVLFDGWLDDETCSRLFKIIEERHQLQSSRGLVRGMMTAAELEVPAERKWVRSSGEQSNSVAFLSERFALKLYRRVEPGVNPEFELSAFLTEKGFTRIPQLSGALMYERDGVEPGTLGILQQSITHQGSGWDFSIDELRRYYERVGARRPLEDLAVPAESGPRADDSDGAGADSQPPPLFAALENWYLANATTLGRRTGELHVALASGNSPEFAPEPLDGLTLDALCVDMAERAQRVLDLLESAYPRLSETARGQAEAVLAQRTRLPARFDAVKAAGSKAGWRTRIHGDYHLGQVLRTEEDFIILDFEGEPTRPLRERREKHSPLKDVAGMIRSFSYAAYAALFAFTLNVPDGHSRLEPWADTWQHWVSEAFLSGYGSVTAGTGILPEQPMFNVLLRAFVLDKALYELGYELNNRPEWVRIPLAGILKVL